MSVQEYLAERYLSGPKADAILARASKKKAKKRKVRDEGRAVESAVIKDDDIGWGDEHKEDDDDVSEAVIAKDRMFKKRKTAESGEGSSGWSTVRPGQPSEEPDEQPVLVVEETEEKPFVGGLVKGQMKKPEPKVSEPVVTAEEAARMQETVYRDATGRKIDTKAARAEAARKKREQEEREAKKMEWGKGLVQRDEAEKMKAKLEQLKNQPFARGIDDKELNEEQKSKDLWNDPAAAFLTKKRTKGPRKPEYTGPPPPPNRFGIRPGYRWDGVDRGNGFEKKLFQSRNASKRSQLESYQWGAEDM
ncbi:Pre-mRNA-splicing factor of RES complex-domain-containing protein [Rhodocollybia butyracea]|uniref:Pre-mRNA-splicing factor of RES complex-domain-containing protein n=1 Tax=Rhodocollybia butyracea TaxID=206335 RepID=A0A9P5Q3L5_9AGAR|nr:Pre-mRNA-splicing factor of RES complex-domain-containing protein [Rhodocollybia butyracea]